MSPSRFWAATWYCLAVLAISRFTLLSIGLVAREIVGVPDSYVWIFHVSPALDIWGVWDSGWFGSIIIEGYMSSVSDDPATLSQANWAFFPLYPMAASAVLELTGLSLLASMLLVANLSFAAALIWIKLETEVLYGASPSNWAVVLICTVPGTHVFSSAYSESTFMLFVIGSLANARTGNWLIAGLLAAFAALTRSIGILLLIPMVVYFLQMELGKAVSTGQRRSISTLSFRSGQFPSFALACMFPCLAIMGFMIFLHFRTGDFLAFLTIQKAWGRTTNFPVLTLLEPILDFERFPVSFWPNAFAAWAATVLCAILIFRRQWAHAAFSVSALTVLLSAGMLSIFRLILPIVPLFMIAGSLLANRVRIALPLVILLALTELVLMWGWALGWEVY